MKQITFTLLAAALSTAAFAQPQEAADTRFTVINSAPATPVKNQAATGTCWCFSTTSLVESQALKNKTGTLDLSEMFTVRNIYIEKARNYVLRQGHAQFGEGGLGHDLVRAIGTYGAVPETVYSGMLPGQKMHNHQKMEPLLQKYVDSILKLSPLPADWIDGYTKILDDNLGKPPASFDYNGKQYTPKSFAAEVLKFNADDYVNITSFTHHPYYKPFVLEVPDNFSNASYYNVPLDELIKLTEDALKNGNTILWDADVSNKGFMQDKGIAVNIDKSATDNTKLHHTDDFEEGNWDADRRQKLFENLTTQDDHLMHIVGIEKSKEGNVYFLVKNSWGNVGPDHGYINVSEAYFAINTVSLVVPKAALSKAMLEKLGIK